jgi:LysR family nitrogen assimilation transcriptional regulator
MGAGLQAARIIDPVIVRKIALSVASHRPVSVATRLVARQTRLHIENAFKTISLSPL